MENTLTEKLWNYIVHNNPDLMFNLQENYSVTQYLKDKISGVATLLNTLREQGLEDYLIEDMCMEELTRDLRPSRYNYIRRVFEEEFPQKASVFRENGTMTYELINMMESCREVFEALGFSEEGEEDRMLYYAITGTIDGYLTTMKEAI